MTGLVDVNFLDWYLAPRSRVKVDDSKPLLAMDIVIGVAISVTFGFIMTFPLALLFEIGGGSIIAGVVYHFAIDCVNLFENLDGIPMLLCLGVAMISAITVFTIGYRSITQHKISNLS